MPKIPATESLRTSTRELHSRIEATPFAKALLSKTLNLDAYVGYIRVMAVIHAALEVRLDACAHPLVSTVRTEALRRLPELLEDNEIFRWRLIPDAPKAVQAALRAASHIMFLSKENPMAMLGCLYVLGGSTKGAVVLAPLVAQALHLSPGRGLSYLTRHGGQGPAEWNRTAEILDAVVNDPGQIESIVEAAQVVFQCIYEAFEALWPVDQTVLRHCATALNPEAGNHAVPQDDRDLGSVLRASERCLAAFPYFLYRYGLRGKHFTDSDGAWLATLPNLGIDAMQAQVVWLAGVLSSRGMPRLLLARHMEILAEELLLARPDQVERSKLLQDCAFTVFQQLDTLIPRDIRDSLVQRVQKACGRFRDFACAEAVALLASAVVDEVDGLEDATRNLLIWLADPARFSLSWVEAMNDTLAALLQSLSTEHRDQPNHEETAQ